MRISVIKSDNTEPVTDPASRNLEITLTAGEAKALLAKNAAIRAWLKPTATGLLLLADSDRLRELGFVDFGARVDAESSQLASAPGYL